MRGRALQDGFVDVGDVLRVAHAEAPRFEVTHEDVEDEERARVSEMRRVVRRHTAHVQRHGLAARTERDDAPSQRVVQREHPGRKIQFLAVPLPAELEALRVLRAIGSPPTAPYREEGPRAAIEAELARVGVASRRDRWGNLLAETGRGSPRRAVALVAHMDHPAFEVVDANG